MDFAHSLPHHRLHAYTTALSFLRAVQDTQLRDRELRTQALRAAKSVCLNIAEGAGRVTRADKARAYTIARGELVEAVAAVEIALASGDARRDAARASSLSARSSTPSSANSYTELRRRRGLAAAPPFTER